MATDDRLAADQRIEQLRREIDRFDAELIRLVGERARLSDRIQAVRLQVGGIRLDAGREAVIIQRYRGELGPDGSALGKAVLRICRGASGGL